MNYPSNAFVLFVVLFGPSTLSLAFTVTARKFVQNALLRVVCGSIALLLLVVQGRWLLRMTMRLVKDGGDAVPILFTLAGFVAFLVSVAFLVMYFVRPSRQYDKSGGSSEVLAAKRPRSSG